MPQDQFVLAEDHGVLTRSVLQDSAPGKLVIFLENIR